MKIGIDVGNYDTKTQHTTIPSSFKKSDKKNPLSEKELCYNGNYYIPTIERNNQQFDKTESDYCIIMSLFAIAEEIMYSIQSRTDSDLSQKEMQDSISRITDVILGVGLPVGHFSSLSQKTCNLYKSLLGSGVKFTYRVLSKTYEFNFRVSNVTAFPQDYAAASFNDTITIPSEYEQYIVIGWGGGTVDVIPVSNKSPIIDKCITLNRGTTAMYKEIIKVIQRETGDTLDYGIVESVLLEKKTIVPEGKKRRIREIATEYCNTVVDDIIAQGFPLKNIPCVIVGGGGQLCKETLSKNPKFAFIEFVDDVHANAIYYAKFVKAEGQA